MSTVEPELAELKDEVKLALVGAITKGAARATNEERCRALRDLAQAFIFLPVRGDLPDFVHSHGGVPFSPGGGAGPASASSPPAAGVHGPHPVHHSSVDTPPLPHDLEERLDDLMEGADGADDEAGEEGGADLTPTPTPITPGQIRLEDELEEARVALVDALANLARAPKNPIENSTCIVLLAEAFDLLPPPIGTMGGSGRGVPPTPPTTPAPPSLGHSHGA